MTYILSHRLDLIIYFTKKIKEKFINKRLNMNKKALITGISGQDGPYLAKLLLEKDYKVFDYYQEVKTKFL